MPGLHIPELLQRLGEAVRRPFRREPEPFGYVALGDSTVEGIGATDKSKSYAHLIYTDLNKHYDKVNYENFGKHGARVHDVVTRQLDAAIKARPKLITLSVGANDILHGTNLRSFRDDMRALLHTLSQTGALLIVTNVPDFSFTRRVPRAIKPAVRMRIKQYNRVIDNAAIAAGATVVDTFQESAVIAKRFPEAVSGDNFHPSDLGYLLWANTMLTIIHERMRNSKRPLLSRL